MITRELLEHYLRAVGIKETFVPEANVAGQIVPWIAGKQKVAEAEVGFRLGLCAAAEHVYSTQECDELLRMARVDPVKWEKVRNG
jgi:hypothetical protein